MNRSHFSSLALAVALGVTLAGCAELGTARTAALPADVHAKPTDREVAEHPCRYGDVAACLARCEADSAACNAVGIMFEFDSGTRSDPAIASGFYNRACEGEYAPGCNNLAWLYLRGAGVPQDQPHAMLLFMAAFDASKMACLRGDGGGCLLAGELLYEDHAQPKDGETAVAFFRRACEAGEPRGCAMAEGE